MKINYEVPPPFAIQLEPVEGCNLACSFCAIQSIRDNGADADLGVHGKNSAPYRFMEPDHVEHIAVQAKKLGWNPRWEFAMHGEPTMHKGLHYMIEYVRRHHPKGYIMVTSNGGGLVKDTLLKIAHWFDVGLNTLAIDDYKHSGGLMDKIRTQLTAEFCRANDIKAYRYPRDPDGNPHKRHNKRKIVLINDISENTTGNHKLTNQGGSSFTPRENLAERCAKPFRELSVRWDGSVALCCDDWPGKYKVGNITQMPLEDIWYHPRMEAARRRLYQKDRNFGPCKGCDVHTLRNGLLPDKLGRSTMAEPDAESDEYIKQAMRGKVFTIKLAP